jgi:hypothetical protein
LLIDTDYQFRTFAITSTDGEIYGETRSFTYNSAAGALKDKLALITPKFISNNEISFVYALLKRSITPSEAGIC